MHGGAGGWQQRAPARGGPALPCPVPDLEGAAAVSRGGLDSRDYRDRQTIETATRKLRRGGPTCDEIEKETEWCMLTRT
eukprot:COSAG01_NODE_1468_length_10210_cov_44.350806_4_plen_79_part_00